MNANTLLSVVVIVGVCTSTNLSGDAAESFVETEESQHVGRNEALSESTSWEPRRYLGDERPFLVKFKEIADEIEVFPFQWVIFPGTLASNLVDSAYVNHQDAQWFFHFADLARSATTRDLDQCVAYLAEATPKERVLLLVVLHFSLNDAYLPVIARYVDDYSVPFPRTLLTGDKVWKRQRAFESLGERGGLGSQVRAKKEAGAALSGFERRVAGDIGRFQVPPLFSQTSPQSWGACWMMEHVNRYALVILEVRGCKLVESMNEMSRIRSKPRPGTGLHADCQLTVASVFTDEAWRQFRSTPLDVRRLHHEYLLEVECVAPPHQEEAVVKFVKRLESMPPRTVTLACFSVASTAVHELRCDRVLVPNWREYAKQIPEEQIEELLTSENLGAIDATLGPEAQFDRLRGYRPYLQHFLRYVLKERSQWFDEEEFRALESRFNLPARKAWADVEVGAALGSNGSGC